MSAKTTVPSRATRLASSTLGSGHASGVSPARSGGSCTAACGEQVREGSHTQCSAMHRKDCAELEMPMKHCVCVSQLSERASGASPARSRVSCTAARIMNQKWSTCLINSVRNHSSQVSICRVHASVQNSLVKMNTMPGHGAGSSAEGAVPSMQQGSGQRIVPRCWMSSQAVT